MKCEKCGAEFGSTAKFCPECGAKIAAEVQPQNRVDYPSLARAIASVKSTDVPESEYKKRWDEQVDPESTKKWLVEFFKECQLLSVRTAPEIRVSADCLIVHREYGEHICALAHKPRGVDDAGNETHDDVWNDEAFPPIGIGKDADAILLNTFEEKHCPECKGRGKEFVDDIHEEVVPCTYCAGSGWTTVHFRGEHRVTCSTCEGRGAVTVRHNRGYWSDINCSTCEGAGRLRHYKTILSQEKIENEDILLPFVEGECLGTEKGREIFKADSILEPVSSGIPAVLKNAGLPNPIIEKYTEFCNGIVAKHGEDRVFFKSIAISVVEDIFAYEWSCQGTSFIVRIQRDVGNEGRPWVWSQPGCDKGDEFKKNWDDARAKASRRKEMLCKIFGVLCFLLLGSLINLWCCLSFKGDVWLSGSAMYSWYVSQADSLEPLMEEHLPLIGAFGGWYGVLPFLFAVVLLFYVPTAMAHSRLWYRIVGWVSIIPFVGFLCSIYSVPQGFLKTVAAFILCVIMGSIFLVRYNMVREKEGAIGYALKYGGFLAKLLNCLWFVAVSYAAWRYFI